MTTIECRPFQRRDGQRPHDAFTAMVSELVARDDIRRVCDFGGGARPLLDIAETRAHGLEYLVVDISQEELDNADVGYLKEHRDATERGAFDGLPHHLGSFDLVISRVVAEHIRRLRAFHASPRSLLWPGGLAAHFYPTLYWPPLRLNRVLTEHLSRAVLLKVQRGGESAGKQGKFSAYYRWTTGPTRPAIARFRGAGFEVDRWVGYFGQANYVARLPGLRALDALATRLLVNRPVAALTSYSDVVLRKPLSELGGRD